MVKATLLCWEFDWFKCAHGVAQPYRKQRVQLYLHRVCLTQHVSLQPQVLEDTVPREEYKPI